jgi:acetyl-CoA synthetase
MSRPETLAKDAQRLRLTPNYDPSAPGPFSWDAARKGLNGLPGGRGVNLAFEAVDRHVLDGRGDKVALRILRKKGNTTASPTCWPHSACGAGERVFVLPGACPSCMWRCSARSSTQRGHAAVLGLRARAHRHPRAHRRRARARHHRARALPAQGREDARELPGAAARDPDRRAGRPQRAGNSRLGRADARCIGQPPPSPTDPDDMALLHFTSGTTGTPKGAMHVHEAVLTHYATGRYALDLHDDDVFWCTADPGWVTGTSYGIIAPLLHGVTSIVDEAEFDAERWYRILLEQRGSASGTRRPPRSAC